MIHIHSPILPLKGNFQTGDYTLFHGLFFPGGGVLSGDSPKKVRLILEKSGWNQFLPPVIDWGKERGAGFMILDLLGGVVICGLAVLVSFLLGDYLQERSDRRQRRLAEERRLGKPGREALLEEDLDGVYVYGEFGRLLAERLLKEGLIGRGEFAGVAAATVELILAARGEEVEERVLEELRLFYRL